jgi:uncharacterized RDD family membrane protein YckC
MATKELPELIREFVDMARTYLRQETVEPAKALGRFISYVVGAAAAWALGALLVAVALMRGVIYLLPEGPYWEALGYLLTALLLTGAIATIVYAGQRGDEEGGRA